MPICPLCGGGFVVLSSLAFRKCAACGFALADDEPLPDLDALSEDALIDYLRAHRVNFAYLAIHATGIVRAAALTVTQ